MSSDRSDADQETVEPAWGPDAASSPPAYWEWIDQWNRYRDEHRGSASNPPLPTTGPLLSVVVPVYRPDLGYLRECTSSVVGQSYGSWELWLSDDGSQDRGLTTLMGELAAAEPRVKCLAAADNGGISVATNRAVDVAAGEFVVLLDQDDTLEADALAEVAAAISGCDEVDVIYSDEDRLGRDGRRQQPHFKPDWDPDLLLSFPYLGHVTVVRRRLLSQIGAFRSRFDGSQDYDMMLRATEEARRIVHIPKVLYHWRVVPGSAAGDPMAKPWAHDASRRALADAVARRGIDGSISDGPFPGAYHLRRAVHGSPTVGVIIPFRDQAALTVECLDSLRRSPGYEISQIVLVDNGSTEPETRVLRRQLEDKPRTRVLDYPGAFNWAAINNLAVEACQTDLLLFLNNDIEATSDGWLHALVELGQRPEVGAVGARLVYPDGKVQHAGVVLGMQGIAAHLFNGLPPGRHGYFSWDRLVRGYSALTAACMLVRRDVFEEVGGFGEVYPVAFNDIDFCLKLGRAGYRLLYTPHAQLTHYESVSRGLSGYSHDFQAFLARWWDQLQQDDPAYNPNLGRFEPWCPLRAPGENEAWLLAMRAMVPSPPDPAEDPATPAAEPVA